MPEPAKRIEAIAQKLAQCLGEEGLDPQVELREDEAIVVARTDGEEALRVVAHVATREFHPANAGAAEAQEARRRLADAISRPTLEPRSAAGAPFRAAGQQAAGDERQPGTQERVDG